MNASLVAQTAEPSKPHRSLLDISAGISTRRQGFHEQSDASGVGRAIARAREGTGLGTPASQERVLPGGQQLRNRSLRSLGPRLRWPPVRTPLRAVFLIPFPPGRMRWRDSGLPGQTHSPAIPKPLSSPPTVWPSRDEAPALSPELVEELCAVALELRLADPRDLQHLLVILRTAAHHRSERAIREDDVRWHVRLVSQALA